MAKKTKYEIGGMWVSMTAAQAARWNASETTEYDLDTVRVDMPDEYEYGSRCRDGEVVMTGVRLVRCSHTISLRRALNHRLSPETAEMMTDMMAVPE